MNAFRGSISKVGVLLLAMTHLQSAVAAEKRSDFFKKELLEIPKQPTIPIKLERKREPKIPHCERFLEHDGRRIECDSQKGLDAYHLKLIVQDVPPAIAEIEAYQRAQNQVRYAAYAGTLGIASIILGGIVSHPLVEPDGTLKTGGYMTIAGVALVANAAIYAFSLMKVSEKHLGKAVEYYNQEHPEKPVRLLFDTSVHF